MQGYRKPYHRPRMHQATDLAVYRSGFSVQDEQRVIRRADHVLAKYAALHDWSIGVSPFC